jgi:hypothetical protein
MVLGAFCLKEVLTPGKRAALLKLYLGSFKREDENKLPFNFLNTFMAPLKEFFSCY